MNTFADFADAMARPSAPAPVTSSALERVAVLGGGPEGRMLAAIALSEGVEVTLFTAYGTEREAMRAGIALRGAGPVGSYQVDADAAPSVRTTADLDQAVQGADVIFLTGPVHKQRTYAMVLADHLSDGQVLAIAPARTFGALETRWLLGIGGCTADVTLAEVALPFWRTVSGSTLNLSAAHGITGATLPANQPGICAAMAPLLPGIAPIANILASSFSDGSGLVEVPTLMLGGALFTSGGPEIPLGGTPLPENQTFRNLIGPEHLTVISDLAAERRETARRFGIRDLPGDGDWLDTHAGQTSGDGSRPVPDSEAARNIVRDAVIGSLVPLVSAAQLVGVKTPAHDAMIGLASSSLKADLATAGRKLPAMGVDGADPDTARRALDAAIGGTP